MLKCRSIFENLGWDVSQEEKVEGCPYRFDLVLRHSDKVYGFVEVIDKGELKAKAERVLAILNSYIAEYKPLIFVITNGYSFDVYHKGEFYGSLTVPPTPEDVDLLFGGEDDV